MCEGFCPDVYTLRHAPLSSHVARNYTADSTSFVVTYPIDSAPANRAAAVAWEAAFVALAKGKLTDMAAAAGLQLAFSTERCARLCDEFVQHGQRSACAVNFLGPSAVLVARHERNIW